MYPLIGDWGSASGIAIKAGLMFVTALVGLRLSERRTLVQMSPFDFVAAVAVGAIIGKTVITPSNSYVQGAVGLLAVMVLHRLVSLLRFWPRTAHLLDHRLRILVRDGQVQPRQLLICGLTEYDLLTQLRLKGVRDLDEVRMVLYEPKGGLTVITREQDPRAPLITAALTGAREPADQHE